MFQYSLIQAQVEQPINVTWMNEATRELMKRLMLPKLSYKEPDPEEPPHDPTIRYWWEVAGRMDEESTRAIICQIRETLPENRVEPNDKLTKLVFNPSDDILSTGHFYVTERPATNRLPKINTPVNFTSETLDNFDAHDRDVGMACFTLFEAGSRFATTEQIYRVMTGNTKARLYQVEDERIKDSLRNLIGSTIRIGMEGLRSMKYNVDKMELFGSILPAKFVTRTIVNGSTKTLIEFLDESPLVTLAKIKNYQLLTYNLESMNMTGRVSVERMALANYARRRIEECRVHPQLTKTLRFDDIFDKNGLSDKSKNEKKRYRDYLGQCFNSWVSSGIIADYEFVKSAGKAHGYHGIRFNF